MKPELCGTCIHYYEWNGRGCCNARQAYRIKKTTNYHCLNYKDKENNGNDNNEDKNDHQ